MVILSLRKLIMAGLLVLTHQVSASQIESQYQTLPNQDNLAIKNMTIETPKYFNMDEQNAEFLKLLKKNRKNNKGHGILHALNQTLEERNKIRDNQK